MTTGDGEGIAGSEQRVAQIRAFQRELADLERAGVLGLAADQRAAVESHHQAELERLARDFDADTTTSLQQLSLGLRLATLLGTAALSAAVVLFVLRYWGAIPTAAQLALALGAAVVPLGIAEAAARRERTLYVASLFAVVAASGFALDLSVLVEALNLPDNPHLVLAWGGFALLVAYRFGIRLLLVAGLAACSWWVAASLFSLGGYWFLDFLARPEVILVPGVIALLLPSVVRHPHHRGFSEMYRVYGLVVLGIVAAAIGVDGVRSILPFGIRGAEVGYTLAGFALGVGAIVIGVQRGWRQTTQAGTLVALLLMVVKAVDWWWDLVPGWVFFLILGLLALLSIAGLKRLRALAVAAP